MAWVVSIVQKVLIGTDPSGGGSDSSTYSDTYGDTY